MKTGKRMAPEDNNKCNWNAVGLGLVNLQKTKATQKQNKTKPSHTQLPTTRSLNATGL